MVAFTENPFFQLYFIFTNQGRQIHIVYCVDFHTFLEDFASAPSFKFVEGSLCTTPDLYFSILSHEHFEILRFPVLMYISAAFL